MASRPMRSPSIADLTFRGKVKIRFKVRLLRARGATNLKVSPQHALLRVPGAAVEAWLGIYLAGHRRERFRSMFWGEVRGEVRLRGLQKPRSQPAVHQDVKAKELKASQRRREVLMEG